MSEMIQYIPDNISVASMYKTDLNENFSTQ